MDLPSLGLLREVQQCHRFSSEELVFLPARILGCCGRAGVCCLRGVSTLKHGLASTLVVCNHHPAHQ